MSELTQFLKDRIKELEDEIMLLHGEMFKLKDVDYSTKAVLMNKINTAQKRIHDNKKILYGEDYYKLVKQ